MTNLKICIVGFGNIARRYINITEKILEEYKIKADIDIVRSGKSLHQSCPSKYKVIIHNPKNIYKKYDLVFIVSTYPVKILHLKQFLHCGLIFIDKPVFINKREENIILNHITRKNFKKIFVGYCLRYHPKIIESLKFFRVKKKIISEVNIRYLTNMMNWRKDINFKDSAGYKEYFNGGGAANELSHEIDLLFNYLKGFKGEIKGIETNWNNLLNHDISYNFKIKFKEIKYSVFVDTFNNLNLRDIVIRSNKKDHIFNLLLDEDINKMYYSMISNILQKAIDLSVDLKLPSINKIEKITKVIENIHNIK